MEKNHPYEEPPPPMPLCAFKYEASKLSSLLESYQLYKEYIEYFGAFEYDRPQVAKCLAYSPEDFINKVLTFLNYIIVH